MILTYLIIILMAGGIIAWIFGSKRPEITRWISLLTVLSNFIIILSIWLDQSGIGYTGDGDWVIEYDREWIPAFGIDFHLALDGLSILMLALTFFIGIVSILVSWSQIKQRIGFFYFNLLWVLAGITGVFISMDLFLFYFFWEVMLIPMYFIISVWGYENRTYASYKFFLFTQTSGLLMFLSILGLYFIHGSHTGYYTFNFDILKNTVFSKPVAWLLMSGFVIAFFVKIPAIPVHTWLPDAHAEAPTAGSIILAGLMLKTGAYGIIRFVIPLFTEIITEIVMFMMIIGMAGIIYGAVLSFAQTDLKRIVAYTSVSHMGFVIMGIFSLNEIAYQGVVIQIIAHGISTGALFAIVGMLQERTHTRDINAYSGIWASAPKMGAMMLIFTMASLGLPGLANFIAEFLILLGSFKANMTITIIATFGLVAATIYSLRLFQSVFQNKIKENKIRDVNLREIIVLASMVIVIVWVGLFPRPVLQVSAKPVYKIMEAYGYYDPVKSVIVNRDSVILLPSSPIYQYEQLFQPEK